MVTSPDTISMKPSVCSPSLIRLTPRFATSTLKFFKSFKRIPLVKLRNNRDSDRNFSRSSKGKIASSALSLSCYSRSTELSYSVTDSFGVNRSSSWVTTGLTIFENILATAILLYFWETSRFILVENLSSFKWVSDEMKFFILDASKSSGAYATIEFITLPKAVSD